MVSEVQEGDRGTVTRIRAPDRVTLTFKGVEDGSTCKEDLRRTNREGSQETTVPWLPRKECSRREGVVSQEVLRGGGPTKARGGRVSEAAEKG